MNLTKKQRQERTLDLILDLKKAETRVRYLEDVLRDHMDVCPDGEKLLGHGIDPSEETL